jgi:antitoxin component YwqK of YwqJK toxin-antitoxin module
MKAILFALFVGLLMFGCGESSKPSEGVDMNDTDVVEDAIADAVDASKIQNRNGFCYLRNEETPFTGRAASFYDNGQKRLERTYKEGKQHGLYIGWYENGQKQLESNWKDGKLDGLMTVWYESGQKIRKKSYKDGKLVTGFAWKPNGKKCPVTNVVNGNGVWVWYNEDGKEMFRETFDGGRVW